MASFYLILGHDINLQICCFDKYNKEQNGQIYNAECLIFILFAKRGCAAHGRGPEQWDSSGLLGQPWLLAAAPAAYPAGRHTPLPTALHFKQSWKARCCLFKFHVAFNNSYSCTQIRNINDTEFAKPYDASWSFTASVTDKEELIVPDGEEIDGLLFSVQELGQ